MDDHKDQAGAKTTRPEHPVELSHRLSSLRTESPGVIDLRHPGHLYAAKAGWVVQRLPLVDHQNARYGVEGQAPRGGQEFVAGRGVTEMTGAPSAPLQRFPARPNRAGTSEMKAEQMADSVADNRLSGRVRISRKPAQPASRPAPSPAEESAGPAGIQEAIGSSRATQSGQTRADRVSSSPALMLQKKTGRTRIDEQGRGPHPPEAPASVNESVTGATPVAAMRLIDKNTITQPKAPAHEGPGQISASQRPERLVFRTVSSDKSDGSRESRDLPAEDAGRGGMASTSALGSETKIDRAVNEGASSLPLIKPYGPAPHIQRRAQSGQAGRETARSASGGPSRYEQWFDDGAQPKQESAAGNQSPQPVVISEVRDNPAAPSSLVWRKSARRAAAEPVPKLAESAALIARQVDSPAASQASSEGNQIVAAPPTQSGSGINMGKVVQEVIRVVSRNLEVERERGGLGRWKS